MTSLLAAKQLGFEPSATMPKVELRAYSTEDEVQAAIWASYRQVLGHDHLMESERLISAESLLRQGDISVRDFVRAIAQSELYRHKFFHSSPQVRFIELNFKHLLGRAPYDESEITEHVNLYVQKGYEAEINSYIDSEEYNQNFGESIVPYYRGFSTQRGQKTVGFNRMFQLYRGYANSDRAQGNDKRGALTLDLARNMANTVRTPSFGRALNGNSSTERGQLYRIRVIQGNQNRTPQIRRSLREFVVAYEQLTPTLQRLNQRGCQIVGVSAA
ncbi:photosystem I reaction center subunit XII [Synechococcales cyanobacterium C]|uniref:Photosystem I reaction center subunit XII n=1 Tax=Petrachloros mirabilis ULC683 TaxID=2781853 RepID=A0A8K2A8H2_9CYAN|nr:phycobilisome linker polypeptide [Petrachloros mirabilis]NCJ07194.1 photosystem I reaction center subunit XII [Petrachloros mirabilis ULC683]